jgi:hypothetical protein
VSNKHTGACSGPTCGRWRVQPWLPPLKLVYNKPRDNPRELVGLFVPRQEISGCARMGGGPDRVGLGGSAARFSRLNANPACNHAGTRNSPQGCYLYAACAQEALSLSLLYSVNRPVASPGVMDLRHDGDARSFAGQNNPRPDALASGGIGQLVSPRTIARSLASRLPRPTP